MGYLSEFLEERCIEIDEYLKLLLELDETIKSGDNKNSEAPFSVTAKQQKILNSSVYLQLYNVTEATVTKCLEEICNSAIVDSGCKPSDLNEQLKTEWIRSIGKTHVSKSSENRLKDAVAMSNHLTDGLPVARFEIEKGGGGNWDDRAIEQIAKRIGCTLKFKRATYKGIKKSIRDDLGALGIVANLRNRLAHGSISFEECGQYDTASQLSDLAKIVVTYLRELVHLIEDFMEKKMFLKVDSRPAA